MNIVEPGTASVDADNPWLGLASFTEESQTYFFGREAEVAELTRRVQRKLLTLLFGKSGLGKTSILRAGLVPRLRAQGYFPVYLRIGYGSDSPEPSEQIKQTINHAARGRESAGIGVAAGESIWEFLHHRQDVLKDASGRKLIPLLIFDQFEELFTLAQSDEFGRARAARFTEELADLVENRPPRSLEAKLDADEGIAEDFDFSRSDYRVVIALREDYLAPLESLKKLMPSLSQNRLRLAPMTGTQALEAVLRPGRKLVSEEVAEAIVRFVAGGSELQNAEVEPSLLSLICRELNEQRIAQGRSEISQDLLAGSHETILSSFYERSLADQPESVRRIIEDDLLTESGYRENLAEESLVKRFQAAGAAPDALAQLVNRRLLRIEERLDVRRVELTHDVLTGVVKASRDQRHEREAREATERTLAEQRERELAARHALRRARTIATSCTLLAVVAIVAAAAAFFGVQRARRAEQLAQQTRVISEQARQQAEGLLGFLTDDFVGELETFGRAQTIAELSRREVDYFQRLPPQLQDPETVRGEANALVDYGASTGEIGDLSTARRSLDEAIALLERTRRTDRSAATTVVLGRAHTWRCFILGGLDSFLAPAVRSDCQRAVDLLRPVAAPADASIAARRAYLKALASLGLEEVMNGRTADLVRDGREAFRIARQLGIPHDGDAVADADYASIETYVSTALQSLGRDAEARSAGMDALGVANQVLAQHPQLAEPLGAKIIVANVLSSVATDTLNPAEGLQAAKQGAQAGLTLVGIEPKNDLYQHDLGYAYGTVADALWAAGRLREAIDYDRKGFEAMGRASAGDGTALATLISLMVSTVSRQTQLGDFAEAAATATAANAFLSPATLHKLGFTGGLMGAAIDALRIYPDIADDYERGNFGEAARVARRALVLLSSHRPREGVETEVMNYGLCAISDLAGRADYALGTLADAAQAQSVAVPACAAGGHDMSDRRVSAGASTWLSMALAREGKREEAAQTIGPVVRMYRDLERKNHGDQWLPLEAAEAFYAQSLTDDTHRAALLREAAALIAHITPAIANLHDTREWRVRVEAAQRTPHGGTGP